MALDFRGLTEKDWQAFDAKIRKTDGCWLWTAAKTKAGYGTFMRRGLCGNLAHRFAYFRATGDLATGLDIDHLCRVRACVNPAHLQAVSHRENMLRGDTFAARNTAKTHCVNGHALAPQNLVASARGGRVCKTCARERMRALRASSPAFVQRQYAATRRWNASR